MGLSRVWSHCKDSSWKKILLGLYGVLVYVIVLRVNDRILATVVFLIPSINNYPGGYAMLQMNVIELIED